MLYGKAIIRARGRYYGPEEVDEGEGFDDAAAADAEATYLGKVGVVKRTDDMVELVFFQRLPLHVLGQPRSLNGLVGSDRSDMCSWSIGTCMREALCYVLRRYPHKLAHEAAQGTLAQAAH